jgi:hypothetical protein
LYVTCSRPVSRSRLCCGLRTRPKRRSSRGKRARLVCRRSSEIP